jgi:hypothetical protein
MKTSCGRFSHKCFQSIAAFAAFVVLLINCNYLNTFICRIAVLQIEIQIRFEIITAYSVNCYIFWIIMSCALKGSLHFKVPSLDAYTMLVSFLFSLHFGTEDGGGGACLSETSVDFRQTTGRQNPDY